jgi:hypothetical protein
MLSSFIIRMKTFPLADCCLCTHSVRAFSCVSSVTASERRDLPNVCSCNLPALIYGHHNLSEFPVLTCPPPSLPLSDVVKQLVLLGGTSTFLTQKLSAMTVHYSMFTTLIRRTSGRSRGTFKQRNSRCMFSSG